MASAAVEMNPKGDSSLPPKSTKLLDGSDSVFVDDSFGNQTTNEVGSSKVCNHPFTIRGFVLKMREMEPRLCYPFSVKGSSDLWKELPPMVVPNFKYWRCPVCVPEDELDVLKDIFGMRSKVAKKRHKGTNAAAPAIPLVGQSPKVTNAAVGVRITEVSASIDLKDNRDCSPTKNVCADIKGKGKAHTEDDLPPFTGFLNNFFKNSSSQGILVQTADVTKASSSDGKDSQTEKDRENSRCLSEDNRVEVSIHGVTADLPGIVSRHCSQSPQVNLPDLNENIINVSEDDDDYLGAERRKKPKVRLLSELLGLKETQVPAKERKRNPSSAGSLDENVKRKRVGFKDEVPKCTEINVSNIRVNKVFEPLEISESKSENGSESGSVSIEKISDALAKKRSRSKDLLLEKRNKKIKVDHGESSSMSRQKVKPKSILDNGKSFDLLQTRDVSAYSSERNSVLTKKRGKVLQVPKETTFLVSCKSRMPQESGATHKDKEAEQNATVNVRSAFGNAQQVPTSSLSKENDQPCIPIRKGGFCAPSSQVEPIVIDDKSVWKHKENQNIGETNIAFRTTSAGIAFTENQSDESGERNNDLKTSPKEKKAGIPEAEGRSPLSPQIPLQVPNSIVNHKALTNEVRGQIQDIDINSIPTDDKTNEQGLGDDIPMEIVELMAKNQYERHLDDPMDKHNFQAPSAGTGTFRRQDGIFGSYGQRMENIAQPHFLSMQKPLFLDNRNSVINGSWGPLSDSSSNPIGARGLPRENPASTMYFSPGQSQEQISPYSSHGLAPNNWNGNTHMGGQQRLPPRLLRTLDSYSKLNVCAPRQTATDASPQIWPTVISSRMPLGITNPQMISQCSNVLNREKIHHQSPGSMFSFSSAATQTRKQQTLNFSNAYNSGYPESSVGSVDVNDDSVPAMQLLGMVRSNGNSQNTDLSLGPQKTTGFNSSRQSFIKSTGRPSAMQDNYHHPCYPTTLTTRRPFAPSYQNSGVNIGRTGAGFIGAIPLTSRGQRNMEGSHFAPPGGESQPLRQQMASSLDKEKSTVSVPSPLDKGKDIASMGPAPDKDKGIAFMGPAPDKGKGIASIVLPLDKDKGIASMALPLCKGKGIASISSTLDKGKGIASMSSLLHKGKDITSISSPLDRGKGISPTLSFANTFPMIIRDSPVHPRATAKRDRKKFFPASDKDPCHLNLNPSEFTDLKLAQSFMIGAADLRSRAPPNRTPPNRTPKPKGNAKKPESSGSKPGASGSGREKQPKQGP